MLCDFYAKVPYSVEVDLFSLNIIDSYRSEFTLHLRNIQYVSAEMGTKQRQTIVKMVANLIVYITSR